MDNIESISFEIISSVGIARSMYIEAISLAKENRFEEARKQIEEGEKIFLSAHKSHAKLIQEEANGEKIKVQLLLMHAEDQLVSTEAFKIIANEFIDVYEILNKKI